MFPYNLYWSDLFIIIIYCTAYIAITIYLKPRMWLHDFPADIQALAAPKTPAEKRLTTLLGVPFIVVLFLMNIVLSLDIKPALGANFNFGTAWLYAYALFFGFNLWDLVVIDWIGTTLIDPQHPPIAGTEGAAGYRNYKFHFYGFLKGCVIGIAFATIVAIPVTLLA